MAAAGRSRRPCLSWIVWFKTVLKAVLLFDSLSPMGYTEKKSHKTRCLYGNPAPYPIRTTSTMSAASMPEAGKQPTKVLFHRNTWTPLPENRWSLSSRKTLPVVAGLRRGGNHRRIHLRPHPGWGYARLGRSSPFTFSQNFIAGELAQNRLKLPLESLVSMGYSDVYLWVLRTTILPGGFTEKTASNAMGCPSATPSAARNCGRSGILHLGK